MCGNRTRRSRGFWWGTSSSKPRLGMSRRPASTRVIYIILSVLSSWNFRFRILFMEVWILFCGSCVCLTGMVFLGCSLHSSQAVRQDAVLRVLRDSLARREGSFPHRQEEPSASTALHQAPGMLIWLVRLSIRLSSTHLLRWRLGFVVDFIAGVDDESEWLNGGSVVLLGIGWCCLF